MGQMLEIIALPEIQTSGPGQFWKAISFTRARLFAFFDQVKNQFVRQFKTTAGLLGSSLNKALNTGQARG
jgi:hypothetical protein